MGSREIAAPPKNWPRSISNRRPSSTISPPTTICAGSRRRHAAGRSARSSPTPVVRDRPEAAGAAVLDAFADLGLRSRSFACSAPLRLWGDLTRTEDDSGGVEHGPPTARRSAHDYRLAGPMRTRARLQGRIIGRHEAK